MKVYKSRTPDINLPNLDLLTFLFGSDWPLAKEETKLHIEAANPSNYITKAEARTSVKRVAYVLRHEYGIGAQGPGKDVVLIISSGSPFLPILFYAIVAAGGVFSGASPGSRTTEVVRQVKDGNARLLICSPENKTLTLDTAEQCGILTDRVLVLDSKTPGEWTLRSTNQSNVLQRGTGQMLDWQRVTDQQKLQDTMIALLYSSGTTGLPKGVRLSHWAIMSSCVCSMDVAKRYKAKHKEFTFDTIAHLPFANIAGIDMYCTNPIYMGGSTYWMEKYDFDSFVEYHRRYRPGYQFSVPPIWLRIAKSEKVTDHFGGLQVACTGSAPIGYATAMEVKAKLGRGKAIITQTWGTTETTGVITALDWDDPNATWSVGDLAPNLRLRILNESDQDVDAESGQPGEFLVGGPVLAQGYHNRPEASSESFVDGWYRTGDIGICKDGLVYIVDRKKELIKYKGQQVAPAELEALLTSHSDIADAAVIGIWDASQETEVPRAYVVRKQPIMAGTAKRAITAEEVADFVKENLARHKQVRGCVLFMDQIPKSMSGKILRKELRQIASQEPKAKL